MLIYFCTSLHHPSLHPFCLSIIKYSITTRPSLKRLSASPSNNFHEVIFAVRQNNLDLLEEMLLDRSTPSSPRYQQWLDNDDVGLITSNPIGAQAISTWLLFRGSTIGNLNMAWIIYN